jgi:uncharacterized protein YcbX
VQVAGLWRYPVKSVGGEPMESAHLTTDGVAGDMLEIDGDSSAANAFLTAAATMGCDRA